MKNPRTSDNIMLYIVMLLVSIVGFGGTIFVTKKDSM